jgi:tRNA1(Val) A37 N6-methylase TrmN6
MTQKRSELGPSMEDEDGHFGERVAGSYEQPATDMFEPSVLGPAVDMLADLADSGRALELGIGTGRIALELARRGIPVHGIELSRDITSMSSEREGVKAGRS